MAVILKKKRSIYLFPLMLSLPMCIAVVTAVIKTHSPYIRNVISGVILVLAFWGIIAFYDQYKLNAGLKNKGVNNFGMAAVSALAIGLFFLYCMWGTNFLSLDPIGKINSGLQHRDSLYQSAIAESYSRSIFPSALVNQEAVLRYHTFSCLAVNFLSRIFKMPCFFIYSYLYPILVLPLYGFLQYAGILAAKRHFSGENTLGLSDVAVVTVYNMGLLSASGLSHLGIWKSSYINSESFVTANTLAMLFFILCFHMMKTEKFKNIFLYIGIPFTIFILSGTKISVGCLVTVIILYYFFRTRPKKIKYWLLNFYYLVIFGVSLILFRGGSGGNAGNSKAGFQLFAFIRFCDNSVKGLCGHYLVLSFMAIIFIIFDLKNRRYKKEDFISGKTIWVELISIVTICSFLPGMLLDIGGGSAAYFSYFSEIPALFLLCGHGYLQDLLKKNIFIKPVIHIILFVFMFHSIWINFQYFLGDRENQSDKIVSLDVNIYESAMTLRKLAADVPEEFTIYLDEDAQIFEAYSTSIAGIYIYPALSGIGVINASYCLDGAYYTIHDTTFRGYALAYVNHPKLSFNEALQCARELGKKKVIHMKKNGYEVIDLQEV